MTAEERQNIAAQAMCALITRQAIKFENKKQLVDNAIAYTDMLARRLAEIPADAQQRSENGHRSVKMPDELPMSQRTDNETCYFRKR